MRTIEFEMLAVVVDVVDATWVGIHACFSILLESVVGPTALPQSVSRKYDVYLSIVHFCLLI